MTLLGGELVGGEIPWWRGDQHSLELCKQIVKQQNVLCDMPTIVVCRKTALCRLENERQKFIFYM